MKVVLNGEVRVIDTPNLTDALAELGFGGAKFATALNGNFVPASARTGIVLTEGDSLEVVAPMQGG